MAILEKISYPGAERDIMTGAKTFSLRVDTASEKYAKADGVARVIEAIYDDGRTGRLLVAGEPVPGQEHLKIPSYGGVGNTPTMLLLGDFPNHDAAAEGLSNIYAPLGVDFGWDTPVYSFLAVPEERVKPNHRELFLRDPQLVVSDPALREYFLPAVANGFWIDKVEYQGEDYMHFPAFEQWWTFLKSEGVIGADEFQKQMDTLELLRRRNQFDRLGEAWLMRALLDNKFSGEQMTSATRVTLDELVSIISPDPNDPIEKRLNLRH